MKAAQLVTGGDVVKLMQMPLGPLWKQRALIFLDAEARASNHRNANMMRSLGRNK